MKTTRYTGRRPRRWGGLPRTLLFWLVVLAVCLAFGSVSYWFGRNVLGRWVSRGTSIQGVEEEQARETSGLKVTIIPASQGHGAD